MKTSLLAVAAVALLGLSTPAFAQSNAAFLGVHADVAAGVQDVENDFNTNDVIYSASVGVDAPLDDRWIVGADVTATNVFDDSREFGVGARLGYAVTDNALVFGRVGYARFEDAQNFSDEGLNLGAGVEWRLSNHTYLTTQYRYTDQADGAHGAVVGLGYRF